MGQRPKAPCTGALTLLSGHRGFENFNGQRQGRQAMEEAAKRGFDHVFI